MSNNVTVERLEDQIKWYDEKSKRSQRWFKCLKIAVIVSAAFVGLGEFVRLAPHLVSILGALIVVIEGIQQLNQYQHLWITYRSTAEYLKHEKYLYLATAGPYASSPEPLKLLAERVESLVSQEHAKWVSGQETSRKQ